MEVVSARTARTPRPGWISTAAGYLTVLAILAFFLIGASFSSGDSQERAQGNLYNQLIFLGLLVLTLPLLIEQFRAVTQLFTQGWPIVLLLLWISASTIWASYPQLTLRRASVYIVVYLISLVLAASFRNPTEFQRAVYRSLVVLCAIAVGTAILGRPSDLGTGFRGFFSHKNIAGAAILLTVVTASFAVVLSSTIWRRLLALGILALVWAVLIVTKCKTCVGIGVILSASMPLVGYSLVQSRPRQLTIIVSALVAIVFFFFIATVLSISQHDIEVAVVGDPTFTSRSFLWKVLLVEIAKRPWLGSGFRLILGHGRRVQSDQSKLW